MPTIQSAAQVLDRHALEIRCGLLDVAAALDRVERSDDFDAAGRDPRWSQFRQAIDILASGGNDRAERIQMLFSDSYERGWNK
ncbi:MAG: hypothetical protein JNG89_01275 [Planctomycetaceae bacterium]|nr:hypothetical protein [Planctomycetaceae bacterium]